METDETSSPTPRRRKGVPPVVVSLIVWVVILGTLAAFLIPALYRARESARRATCLYNLKQLGLALRKYSSDFADVYPWRVGASKPDEAWRDLGLAFPNYESDSACFFCPGSRDRRSRLEREFFDPMRQREPRGETRTEPIPSSGSRAVISYSYGRDARGGTLAGKHYTCLPWTDGAKSTVRLLADKKAGSAMTRRSNHRARGKTLGRNVVYNDGHVKWRTSQAALDPDEDDATIGPPKATDYRAWWSDPPYYGE